MWSRDAAMTGYPMTWFEALSFVERLNKTTHMGFADWRLPNRRELFRLVSQDTINPCLPTGHPFKNVFSGYYWTGTTCSRLPNQAWYVHLGGARVFKGMKHGSYMVWPVRTAGPAGDLPFRTGQQACYDEHHMIAPCNGTGQDGELRAGRPWPQERFASGNDGVLDRLTDLYWDRRPVRSGQTVDWHSATSIVSEANDKRHLGHSTWRLPEISELESMCDMSAHSPALPPGHPFQIHQMDCWAATTSRYDPDYAWVLYWQDGAVGVGFKAAEAFSVWLVRSSVKK